MSAEPDALRTEVARLGSVLAIAERDKAYWRERSERLWSEQGPLLGAIATAVERAQQAEATRDAAQARATACEERARRAAQQASDAAALLIAAERQLAEWRGAAMYAANTIHQADDQGTWAAAHFVLCAWADTAVEMGGDPSAGTGDHEREPGRMVE